MTTKIFFKYNPFTTESIIHINDVEITEASRLFAYKEDRLQMWIEKLLPILTEECNDSSYEITFHGTDPDFEDIQEYVADYCRTHSDIKVITIQEKSKNSEDKLKELKKLFDDMQNNCPFEDLKDTNIKENFNQVLSSEFDVSVIATMSSGKSTLINAMLGIELMPAKNEACTATITRIKDVDGKKGYTAICKSSNYVLVEKCGDLTKIKMEKFNLDPNISYIDIEGDIPFVSSKAVHLVLVDTPGPNNARNEGHRDQTYRIIKEKSKPMVLYVLNATQLETNDDNMLLGAVAEAMKVGGKQSKDRFIFAINKVDEFDLEKDDSIECALTNVKQYLANHGIHKPNIYLISADLAKIIRLKKNGYNISQKQKSTLEDCGRFNDDAHLHLSEFAPLSLKNRNCINETLAAAKKNKDVHQEALIHTGVPAVEMAINEYLNKYAYTVKIKTAVDTFKKKLEDKNLYAETISSLQKNSGERENLNKRLAKVEKQLSDGKFANGFRDKINKLNMEGDVNKNVEVIRAKISKTIKLTENSDKKLSVLEANHFLTKLKTDVSNLQSDVKTDLEKILDENIIKTATKLIGEYHELIQSLIEDKSINCEHYKASKASMVITGNIPDATVLIEKYKKSEKVVTGSKWIENESKKWYKPWTWFSESGHFENIYGEQEYVEQKKIYEDFVRPITGNFNENIENAKNEAHKEANKFKDFFIVELDKLDSVMKQKVSDFQKLSKSQAAVEKELKNNENKKLWLDKFIPKLNSILEI